MTSQRIIAMFLALSIVLSPALSYAAQSPEQLQAQIAQLMAQINALKLQISAQQGGNTTASNTTDSGDEFCYTFTKLLQIGSRGADVENIQTALGLEFPDDTINDVTGVYGASTKALVQKFQLAHHITRTGTVGKNTRATLNALYGCNVIRSPRAAQSSTMNAQSGFDTNRVSDVTTVTSQSVLQTPTVKVLSPNGGEVYKAGDMLTISWATGSMSGVNKITVVPFDSFTPITVFDVGNNIPLTTNSFAWQIPPTLTPGQYRAVVQVGNDANALLAASAGGFTIVAGGAVPPAVPPVLPVNTTVQASVNHDPVISSIAGPSSLIGGQSGTWVINATDADEAYLKYSISYGDGVVGPVSVSGSTFTINHTYSLAGKYSLVATVTDSTNSSVSKTFSVYVSVPAVTVQTPSTTSAPASSNHAPTVTAITGPTSVNVGQSTTWTASATDPDETYLNYTVDFGDGSTLPALNSSGTIGGLSHTYTIAGKYNLTVTATDSAGASGSKTIIVYAMAVTSTTSQTSATPLTVSCYPTYSNVANIGSTVSWTANASGGVGSYTYYWSGTDGLSGTSATISTSNYNSAGTKSAQVTVGSGGDQRTVTCTPVTITAPVSAYTAPSSSVGNSVTAVPVSSPVEDRAASWGIFGPGVGAYNKTAPDWHWTLNITTSQVKTVSEVLVSGGGGTWSTKSASYFPLVLFRDGTQINVAYGDTFMVGPGYKSLFEAYGQKESLTPASVSVTVYFTDGTSLSTTASAPVAMNRAKLRQMASVLEALQVTLEKLKGGLSR